MTKSDERFRVRHVMHARFCRVDGLITVHKALGLLREEGALALLVERRDADDEYGLVLPADIARHILAADRAADRVNVYEIMTKPALGVRPDMQVRHCARLFDRYGLTIAPVIDASQEVLGMVSYEDLVLRGLGDFDGG